MILEYLKIIIWPTIVIFALIRYREVIEEAFYRSKVKLSLFGFEIEIKISDLEQSMIATVGGTLSNQQWGLLEKIHKDGPVSVSTEGYKMSMQADLSWIRPIRNAGPLMSLPDGEYIEEAEELDLTPLGKLLIESKTASKSR